MSKEYQVKESDECHYSFSAGEGALADRSFRAVIRDGKTGKTITIDLNDDEKQELRNANGENITNKWLQFIARRYGFLDKKAYDTTTLSGLAGALNALVYEAEQKAANNQAGIL